MRRRNADVLGVLLSFTLLAMCLLAVLLGVKLFARINRGVTLTDNGTRLLPYIRELANQKTRLRQADGAGGVWLGAFDGTESREGDTLFLREILEGEEYLTRVYCWDGQLRELFTPAGSDCRPEDGEVLLPAEALRLSRDGALLTASLTEDGRETELRFLLRDGEAPA